MNSKFVIAHGASTLGGELVEKAREAYALVRRQFKEDSAAESCVKKADPSGKLNVLWSMFLAKYDNPMTIAGAVRFVKSYYAKAKTSDIVALFMVYIEHFNKADNIFQVMESTQKAERALTALFTPDPNRHPLETPYMHLKESHGGREKIKAQQPWFRILHAFERVVIEVPKYKDIINKFIYENLENSPQQDLDQLMIEGTIEKLESFLQLQAPNLDSSTTALITRPTFYCSHHGNNSTHVTERCRYLNSRQTRQFRRSSERGPSRSSFRSRSSDSRRRSWSRDRNYSRDRRDYRQRGPSPHPRTFTHRNGDRRDGSRSRSNDSRNYRDFKQSAMQSEIESKDIAVKSEEIKDGSENKIFALSDYTLIFNTTYNLQFKNENRKQIIGDSGASGIIFNFENLHLVEELQPKVGAIEGAGGTQLGAITHEGVTEFMGVRLPCYVADISKSVIGLGLLTSEYGFEVLFKGENMYIFASRSGERATVQVSNNKLFLLPETLFRQPVVSIMMTCLAADSLVSLWHHRLAHLGDRKLAFMAQQEEYRKRGIILPPSQLARVRLAQYCDCCNLAKAHKHRSTRIIPLESSLPGTEWSVDLMGKNDTPALVTGNHYFIIFTDRKTRLRFGLGLKNNAEESILVAIEEWNKRFVVRAKE